MAKIPTTSTTLLRNIAQNAQNVRWGEFVARYRPMMEAFMRERFPSLEADDIIQETLVALCRVLPSYRYAPDEKGHFRNFLTGILRNKALRQLRKEQRQAEIAEELRRSRGDTPYQRGDDYGRAGSPLPADDLESWRETLFEIALRQFLADDSIADRTKRIFERTAINGESPEAVAESFKMTRHAVDQAKSRAMARLREIVKDLENVAGV
jgi:RNA polymerase sigma factor (sigma-70 family)